MHQNFSTKFSQFFDKDRSPKMCGSVVVMEDDVFFMINSDRFLLIA